MHHFIREIQLKNYLLIILGLIIAIIGFAFAFSGIDPSYFSSYQPWWRQLLSVYQNLLSGIVIGIGGIAIAITGELYRRRLERSDSLVCSSCGKTLQKRDKFCPRCGNEVK